MSKPCGIILFGANGSGKTTLGCELAHIMDIKHIDHEDYAFNESDIPFTDQRSESECNRLMLADILKYRLFVITAVVGDFGNIIPQFYKLAVLIETPFDLRIERIKQRDYERYGKRVCKGGDMYEQHQKFIEFAASRPLTRIEQWAGTLACPVIRVDGTVDMRTNAANIAKRYFGLTSVYEELSQ